MGMGFKVDEEIGSSGGSMDVLVESLRIPYSDSVKEALRDYEFNFVISDPRLPENPIVFASEGFCKMSGYSREEVLGRNCRFLQGPDTDRRTVLELRDAIREERSAQVRILNYTKKGEPFWNLFHLAPVFSKVDGTVIHFVGVQTPICSQLATSLPDKDRILNRLTLDSKPSENFPLKVNELKDLRTNVDSNGKSVESELGGIAATHNVPNGSLNSGSSNHNVLPFSGKHVEGGNQEAEQAGTKCSKGGEVWGSDACKPHEPESMKAMDCMRSLVCQLVESSKGKGEVVENRDNQISEFTAQGVVSSSLMLSLTRIQQSFVLADPHLPDAPIVHASDLFLHLTGYSREEVVGRNCRFLQGPATDPESVVQIRESIKLERPCSVRLLNYRKDKRPFWNLLHIAPVRSSCGKVAFFVGVQLQVSAADEMVEECKGMTAQMKQLSAVGAVRVAVRSLQGPGLRRTQKSPNALEQSQGNKMRSL